MSHRTRIASTVVVFLLGVAAIPRGSAHPAPEVFRIIDIPGATGIFATDINNQGAIVGYFDDPDFHQHGFVEFDRFIGQIDVPDSDDLTVAAGINNRNEIVGSVTLSDTALDGFLLSKGQFTTFLVPSGIGTMASGINDRGDIVGFFNIDGFLRSDGIFTTIRVPGSTSSRANGINDKGQIVGEFGDADGVHGFVLWRGKFVTFDVPDSTRTQATAINNVGQIVGVFQNATGEEHGFLWWKGRFTTISIPDSITTNVLGINDRGQIVGIFVEFNGTGRAFESNVRAFLEHPQKVF